MIAANNASGEQAEECKTTLLIPSRVQRKSSSSAGGHRVIMILVDLDVGSKSETAMEIEVNCVTSHNLTRTEEIRDTVGIRKHI